MTERYYGIYRGTVANNVDPMHLGRITAVVPNVGGDTPLGWAMPCVPLAGKQMGMFMVPQIGAGVWMQFEGGDPDYPVWIGGWWQFRGTNPFVASGEERILSATRRIAANAPDLVARTRVRSHGSCTPAVSLRSSEPAEL